MADRENAPLVAFRDIVKRFGGVTAVKGVTLDVRSGEILALLGENGAGQVDADQDARRHLRPRRGRHLVIAARPIVTARQNSANDSRSPSSIRISV